MLSCTGCLLGSGLLPWGGCRSAAPHSSSGYSRRPLPAVPPSPPPLQVTFVPPGFTRKPPKYERFIRPTGLRMNKAHVTHPELKATFQLAIIGVKKNPNGQAYTGLGVITKGGWASGRAGERALASRPAAGAGWWAR